MSVLRLAARPETGKKTPNLVKIPPQTISSPVLAA
jgi:hypothetical protein